MTLEDAAPLCPYCRDSSGIMAQRESDGSYVAWCDYCWSEGMSYAVFGKTLSEAFDRLARYAEVE